MDRSLGLATDGVRQARERVVKLVQNCGPGRTGSGGLSDSSLGLYLYYTRSYRDSIAEGNQKELV